MDAFSDRHAGDLGGALLPLKPSAALSVAVSIDADYAHLPAVQHTAWMLINLLARLRHVVADITLSVPSKVPLLANVIPFAEPHDDLCSGLERGISLIGITSLGARRTADFNFAVGPGGAVSSGLRILGDGWIGGVARHAIDHVPRSALPIGPYIAACMGAGEVFRHVRIKPESFVAIEHAFFSAWSMSLVEDFSANGPLTIPALCLDVGLAGIGAVANTWLHTIWATPGVSGRVIGADNDKKGIESTNLNRYTLFGQESVSRSKASEAKRMLASAAFEFDARDQSYESLLLEPRPRMLVSAVDRNSARERLQFSQLAPRILSASTRDLRAEVLRCGPPGRGACLRCFNKPEPAVSDEELRAQLRGKSAAEIGAVAEALGIPETDVWEWAQSQKCSETGERIAKHLRRDDDESGTFAVGFVSAFAGTLLAAETYKEWMGVPAPLNDISQRAVFQFFNPRAASNRASFLGVDPQCPFCRSRSGAEEMRVWSERYFRTHPFLPRI